MNIHHNDLRIARKRSHLTQTDLAVILQLTDHNTVSKWELGVHRPSLESILSYHLLFDLPIESFFDQKKKSIAETLSKQIALHINALKSANPDQHTRVRLEFLQSVLVKITALQNV